MARLNRIKIGDTLDCDRVVVKRTDCNGRDLGEVRTLLTS